MSKMEGITPLPWFAVNCGTKAQPMMSVMAERISGRGPTHEVALCATGDSMQEMENANAAYIVHACNSYPALVEALEEAREAFSKLIKSEQADAGAATDPIDQEAALQRSIQFREIVSRIDSTLSSLNGDKK